MRNNYGRHLLATLAAPGADVEAIVESLRANKSGEATVVTLAGLQADSILYSNVEVHAFPDGSFLAIAENQHGNDINFITGETSQLLAGAVSIH